MRKEDINTENQQACGLNTNENSSKGINSISKGTELEYRIKRLLFYMGYYSQTNIVFKTSTYPPSDVITDLDVYGYSFLPDFAHIIKWVDCKSGGTNILQHIGWINGIKSQIAVDEVVFIKQGIRKNINEYARSLGIKIFDLKCLEQMEQNYGINRNDWSGSYDIYTQSKMLHEFSKISIPDTQRYKNISNFITSSYWSLDNYSKIKKCITGIKQMSTVVLLPLEQEQITAIRWAIYTLISLFYLATLELCGDLYYFSDADKLSAITEGLVSGTIPVAKKQEIVNISYKIASEAIKQYIPDFNDSTLNRIDPTLPPPYYKAYCDLINRITHNPSSWTEGLRFLDYYLMEFDLKNKTKPNDFFDEHCLKPTDVETALKTMLHFITSVTGVSKDLFGLLR